MLCKRTGFVFAALTPMGLIGCGSKQAENTAAVSPQDLAAKAQKGSSLSPEIRQKIQESASENYAAPGGGGTPAAGGGK